MIGKARAKGPMECSKVGPEDVNKVVQRKKNIFFFSDAEDPHEADNYGQKGVSLNELHKLKLPVPEGFTITIDAAHQLFGSTSSALEQQSFSDRYKAAVQELEKRTNRRFGGLQGNLDETIVAVSESSIRGIVKEELPLLVSIRASSEYEVPGAARSILNVGLTENLVQKLAERSFNPRWVYDSYRRLLQMFGAVVYGIDERKYRLIVKNAMLRSGSVAESALSVTELQQIIIEFKRLAVVPDDPWEQLSLAMHSIYRSWYSTTAEKFKLAYGIDADSGVGLVVQSMVFGNLNERCGVGYAFSRHPNTGKVEYIAEYVKNAIGADVLAGSLHVKDLVGVREDNPGLYYNLVHTLKLLERHYKDAIEIEFTVENGIFFLLNCVPCKRSALAAVAFAVDMVKEALITEREAIARLDPVHMINYLKPQLTPKFVNPTEIEATTRILTRGVASSFGVAYGKVVMTHTDVHLCKERGVPCILCLPEITTEDISAAEYAAGVITSKGGLASHVSTWLREVGKPGIIAARDLVIDPSSRQLVAMDTGMRIAEGEYVTVDGTNGYVFVGEAPTSNMHPDEDFYTIMTWAKALRAQSILATIESEEEAVEAIQYGADGIGILKTESHFYGDDTIDLSRFILLTQSDSERAAAMITLQEIQKSDLLRIFRAVGDRDIVVRLLSQSSSEALISLRSPDAHDTLMNLSLKLESPASDILHSIESIVEPNPALGVRGCCSALLHTQWTIMQVRAITAATIAVRSEGMDIRTKLLLSTAFTAGEIDRLLPLVREAIAETCAQYSLVSDFKEASAAFEIGVSLSVPRACLIADQLTKNQDVNFITVDTNELTQLTYGIDQSRNESIMNSYEERHVIPNNPFAVLDIDGVGLLINTAISKARMERKDLKVNVFGVHSSESDSIRFFDQIGVDTLTVPKNLWIPAAALAAAQAVVDPQRKFAKRPFRPFGSFGVASTI